MTLVGLLFVAPTSLLFDEGEGSFVTALPSIGMISLFSFFSFHHVFVVFRLSFVSFCVGNYFGLSENAFMVAFKIVIGWAR